MSPPFKRGLPYSSTLKTVKLEGIPALPALLASRPGPTAYEVLALTAAGGKGNVLEENCWLPLNTRFVGMNVEFNAVSVCGCRDLVGVSPRNARLLRFQ